METSVKINDDLKNRLQQLANVRKRSTHWIISEAIRDYLEREESKEDFKQEALESWTSYKEIGRHLTGQEMRAWLKTWGSGEKTKIPPCHE